MTVILTSPATIVIDKNITSHAFVTGKAGIFQLASPASISSIGLEPNYSVVANKIIAITETGEIFTIVEPITVKTTLRKLLDTFTTPRRVWKARLGQKLDNIYRKTIDNTLSINSIPLDMIRVEIKEDPDTHDIISRSVKSTDIMQVVFEKPLEEIPLRRLEYTDSERIILTIDGSQLKEVKINCPLSLKLNRGDLLFRIIRDDFSERPLVIVFQVKEELGFVGYSKILKTDYILSYYDEKLPGKIIESVIETTTKREILEW